MIYNPELLQSVEPIEFEKIISDLLERMGFDVTRTKSTGDGGIDVIAINEQPIISGKYVVQCKRYATGNNVGEPVIRELYGVMHAENANKGILITTSEFTRQARSFAADKQIELIDGNTLTGLLSKYFAEDELEDSIIEEENIKLNSMLSSFKGLEWGSGSQDSDDISFIELWTDEDDKSACRRVNDNSSIGGAHTEEATYYFYRDRFFMVLIPFKNWKNYDLILNYLKANYGKPDNHDLGGPQFSWIVKNVEFSISYLSEHNEGDLLIQYIPILDEYMKKPSINVKSENKQQCFIATAVYESPHAIEVLVLKRWRDRYLINNWFGRFFIRIYYMVGPVLADFVIDNKTLKKLFRIPLDYLVKLLSNNSHGK